MPFCQPTATRSCLTIGKLGQKADFLRSRRFPRRSSPEMAVWLRLPEPCQYLTFGSMSAAITSTMKLTTATMMAMRITMPLYGHEVTRLE